MSLKNRQNTIQCSEGYNAHRDIDPGTRAGNNKAVVLGMFETGLAVGRSLGRSGIEVIGLDVTRKVGFHSRYISPSICPHPLQREADFISFLIGLAAREAAPPVLFITSDEFLLPVSRNRNDLEKYYLMNFPNPDIVECISDKFRQTQLAREAGIPVPQTFIADNMEQLGKILDRIPFPVFVKGNEVTSWRNKMGDVFKGYVATNKEELTNTFRLISERGATGLIQEVIPGPDTSHFKVSCYISRSREILLAFGLQKIRQQPAGFGFGCLVQSVRYPEMLNLGKSFFTKIGYCGVGSAEFKLDTRDGKLKLIEINPRYWQQNALAEKCGMNFPLTDYMEVTGGKPKPVPDYRQGIKWVNIYSDLESFREYRKRGPFPVMEWLRSLKGEKIFSDFAGDDIFPGFREILLENILRRSLRFLKKKLNFRSSHGAQARISPRKNH